MDDFKTMKETIQPVFAPMYKDEYERGFVEGRLSTVKSAVHRAVEGYGKMRELSDEEIQEVLKECKMENLGDNTLTLRFARALLKKAQEK